VVPAEHDDRILVQPAIFQGLEELADAVVHIRDGPVVRTARALDLLRGEVLVPEITDLEQALGVRILLLLGDGDFGKGNVDVLVHVPVLLLDGIGIVGVGEGDGHAEGAGVGTLPHVVVEELLAPAPMSVARSLRLDEGVRGCILVHDLLIVVQLVAPHTGAGLLDTARVVVPLQALVGLLPVHGPAVVARVDVAGQAALVAMQLLADEVHLAGQGGLVAGGAQVVGVGRGAGVDAAGIVVGADLGGELARHHGHTRGGAEGRGAVGVVEDDGVGGEGVKVGGLDLGCGIVHLEEGRGELVGHDVEDVWLAGGGGGRGGRGGRDGIPRRAWEGIQIGSHDGGGGGGVSEREQRKEGRLRPDECGEWSRKKMKITEGREREIGRLGDEERR